MPHGSCQERSELGKAECIWQFGVMRIVVHQAVLGRNDVICYQPTNCAGVVQGSQT